MSVRLRQRVTFLGGANRRFGVVESVKKGLVVVREENGLRWHFSDADRLTDADEYEAERAAREREEAS